MMVVIASELPPAVRGRMKLWFIEPRPKSSPRPWRCFRATIVRNRFAQVFSTSVEVFLKAVSS